MIAAFSFRAWFPLSPALVLAALVLLSAVAGLIERFSRRRRKRALRGLAARWQMTYSAADQLRVAAKVLGRLPVPGAADVHVTDVIYGGQGDRYCYLFTAEYTIGAVRGKRREVRVGSFCEPRRTGCEEAAGPVVFAPEDLRLVEQYLKLRPSQNPAVVKEAENADEPTAPPSDRKSD